LCRSREFRQISCRALVHGRIASTCYGVTVRSTLRHAACAEHPALTVIGAPVPIPERSVPDRRHRSTASGLDLWSQPTGCIEEERAPGGYQASGPLRLAAACGDTHDPGWFSLGQFNRTALMKCSN
jgi:hypothetical protein